MKTAKQIIKKIAKFYNIKVEIQETEWFEGERVFYKDRGVYVICNPVTNQIIYVGKGNIGVRQMKHRWKVTPEPAPSAVMTKSWQWLRENTELDYKNWILLYFVLEKETELSAMEGGLIHLLKPLANDETFKDEGRTINDSN